VLGEQARPTNDTARLRLVAERDGSTSSDEER
jgi:hypothetical protein